MLIRNEHVPAEALCRAGGRQLSASLLEGRIQCSAIASTGLGQIRTAAATTTAELGNATNELAGLLALGNHSLAKGSHQGSSPALNQCHTSLRESPPSLANAAMQLLRIQSHNQSESPRTPVGTFSLRIGA